MCSATSCAFRNAQAFVSLRLVMSTQPNTVLVLRYDKASSTTERCTCSPDGDTDGGANSFRCTSCCCVIPCCSSSSLLPSSFGCMVVCCMLPEDGGPVCNLPPASTLQLLSSDLV